MPNQPETPLANLKPSIGSPATNALALVGYTQLGQLAGVSEQYLAGLHGVGPKAIDRLKDALATTGLSLNE